MHVGNRQIRVDDKSKAASSGIFLTFMCSRHAHKWQPPTATTRRGIAGCGGLRTRYTPHAASTLMPRLTLSSLSFPAKMAVQFWHHSNSTEFRLEVDWSISLVCLGVALFGASNGSQQPSGSKGRCIFGSVKCTEMWLTTNWASPMWPPSSQPHTGHAIISTGYPQQYILKWRPLLAQVGSVGTPTTN